jgi:uncharacterized protein YjbJ (UPF0337 family)
MNYSRLQINYSPFKGKTKEKRKRSIDDGFEQMTGKQNILVGKAQKKYKIAKREAEKQMKEWEKAYG